MRLLATNVFQPVRDHFKRPIHISSGYRSAELNASIKGASKTSQHSLGQALDLDMDGTEITNKQVFDYIKDNLNFDQLINEYDYSWVHVSFNSNGKQRKQILKEAKEVGIKNVLYVMFGFPTETREEFWKTLAVSAKYCIQS
jgi:hypothetical protein